MLHPTARDIDRLARDKDRLFSIEQYATAAEAALKMSDSHVGSLIVNSNGRRTVGILTERDILRRVVAQGRDAFSLTVSAIMSPEVIYCTPDATVSAIQQTMAKYQIRHVPIIEDKAAVGIVTSRDVHAYELYLARRRGEGSPDTSSSVCRRMASQGSASDSE